MRKVLEKNLPRKSAIPKKKLGITSDDKLRRLAFDNSLQANIISTVSNGKIVMANQAARKFFGYSKKEILTKNRPALFVIKEAGFKKMLKERTAEGKSTALVTAIRKNGKLISAEITSAVFMDDQGIENAITTITDMSPGIERQKVIDIKKEKIVANDILLVQATQEKIDIKKEKIVAEDIVLALAKTEARLAENIEWIEYIARSSYDVMWDWNIASNDIYVSESTNELFGYKPKNNKISFADFSSCLLPEEKEVFEKKLSKAIGAEDKTWNDAFKLRRRDGTIASTISRASIVRDEKGKALRLIGVVKDVSSLMEGEQPGTEKKDYSEMFEAAAKLSYDGIWDWNLLTNDFFLGEGFDELFGYAVKNITGNMDDWSKHLHPGDKEAVEKGLQDALISTASHWEHGYRFIRTDGSIANVFGRASIIRDAQGKAVRMIGAIHDISKQQVLEERLEKEIEFKEKQIAEATEDAKDAERSEIGKELHDNVNQLLGASKMYLEMAKRGGEKAEMYLNRSSEYTMNAINEIRKLTKGLTTDIIKDLGLTDAIESLTHDLMETNPLKIYCKWKGFDEEKVGYKFKVNVFRIVQEHLNNILKHAEATKINLDIAQDKSSIVLAVADNGIGFDTSQKREGIGLENIKSRAMVYKGKANFVSRPGEGCVLTIKFSLADVLK